MSVEAIVREVEAAAAAEAEALVATARTEATAVVAAAQAAADAKVREACDRADPGVRAEAMRRVNAARLRVLERRAAGAAELVDAAVEAAGARLAAIAAPGDPRWAAALVRLLEETATLVGAGGTLRVRQSDLAVARTAAERLGCGIEAPTEAEPGMPPGVIGRSADGRVEVDATLPVRLAHARVRLAEPLARLLDVEG